MMITNNIQIEFTSKNEFLHHGIQGQKWGVTNGPPYPLEDYISTGKSLRKAARKEAKAGSKEYSNAKKAAKNYKENMKLAKNIYKDSTNRKVKKAYKAQYKDYKAKYKNAKEEMNKHKQNAKTAKEVLKSLENKSLSEVEQFLKDRGYTTESITKLATKDYNKENKKQYRLPTYEKKSTKINSELTDAERSAREEVRNAWNNANRDPSSNNMNPIPKSALQKLAAAEIKSPSIVDEEGKPYASVNDYIKRVYGNDWGQYEVDTFELVIG